MLGISGLAAAPGYKRRNLPGLTAEEYAIFQGGDAAAALVVDKRVVAAAAEERFDGRKHSAAFPAEAARFCLDAGATAAADLDVVAHSFSYLPERRLYGSMPEYYRKMYDEVLDPEITVRRAEQALGIDLSGKFLPVPHHLAHAASAYVPSGFDRALVLISDGLGERQSATVFVASPQDYEPLVEVPAASSLGLLYGLFTMYLGFRFNDGEYKVMGLAPYGDPSKYADIFLRRWVHLDSDGRYLIPLLFENTSVLERETNRGALRALEAELGPRRFPAEPIEQRHMDIAAALQVVLERCQLHLLTHVQQRTGLRQLAIAGGVGLNCVANRAVLRSGLFDDVYVQPAAGDDGAALGAALYAAGCSGRSRGGGFHPLLGPQFGLDDCRRAASRVDGLDVRLLGDEAELARAVAELLEAGAVIGWFQGRMEFGPRALGNRSILADPRRAELRDRINGLVKMRESFRPFAPAVLAEHASEWFDIPPTLAHRFADMLFVADVWPEHIRRMPAVTHVDGSARVQTVSREVNPAFWRLIHEFGRRTGLPALLNTSFNVQGQPIVRTPDEAVATFVDAGLDALVMGRLLVTRPADVP
ncbi:carbamoyltransferase family protein [Micromonospora sp. CA-263727]|uniref:carbamoyltransferase family protein n=1 Tax=Micromonospora sp. CA-263727 TaxID=3239967 RepID=UPI003D9299D3